MVLEQHKSNTSATPSLINEELQFGEQLPGTRNWNGGENRNCKSVNRRWRKIQEVFDRVTRKTDDPQTKGLTTCIFPLLSKWVCRGTGMTRNSHKRRSKTYKRVWKRKAQQEWPMVFLHNKGLPLPYTYFWRFGKQTHISRRHHPLNWPHTQKGLGMCIWRAD